MVSIELSWDSIETRFFAFLWSVLGLVVTKKGCCSHAVIRDSSTRQADGCLTSESTMKIDTAHAEPMGSLVVEGTHRPFHALACALKPATVRIKRKIRALIAQ